MLFNLLDHASLLPKHPRPLWRDRENLLQFGLIKVSDQKHDLQKSDQKLLLRTFAALAVSYKIMTLKPKRICDLVRQCFDFPNILFVFYKIYSKRFVGFPWNEVSLPEIAVFYSDGGAGNLRQKRKEKNSN